MSTARGVFVTGTDTGVGKTLAACALLHALAQRGLRTAAMKPVAAGAEMTAGGWVNEDVDALVAAATVPAPRSLVNPYCFAPPIAPHLAAAAAGVKIDLAAILAAHRQLSAAADCTVVEGVGGFCVPLNAREDTADLAQALGLPVILVVGLRLGCLSHALLTAQAIRARGLQLAGWIANRIDPAMAAAADNIAALDARLAAPRLGVIPFSAAPQALAAAAALDLALLPILE